MTIYYYNKVKTSQKKLKSFKDLCASMCKNRKNNFRGGRGMGISINFFKQRKLKKKIIVLEIELRR